jgi:hypothetical protein
MQFLMIGETSPNPALNRTAQQRRFRSAVGSLRATRSGSRLALRYTEQIPLRIVSGFAPNLPIAEIHT